MFKKKDQVVIKLSSKQCLDLAVFLEVLKDVLDKAAPDDKGLAQFEDIYSMLMTQLPDDIKLLVNMSVEIVNVIQKEVSND